MSDLWDEWLNPELARKNALARLDIYFQKCDDRYKYEVNHSGGGPGLDAAIEQFIAEMEKIDRSREWLGSPEFAQDWIQQTIDGIPSHRRPGRSRMPDLWRIVQYWQTRDEFADQDMHWPHCFRCLIAWTYEHRHHGPSYRWGKANIWLERAHLVDRAIGGLDGAQNLMPLCGRCHRMMPTFEIDEGDKAIAWVLH